ATLLAGLLFAACTTKIGSINTGKPIDPKMKAVSGLACNSFTWPYGSGGDEALKNQAMEQINTQSQAIVAAADAKEGVLTNVTIERRILPWFWWLMGSRCVAVNGYVMPQGLSAAAEARKKAEEEAKQANTRSCEGWNYIRGVELSNEGWMGVEDVSKEDAQKALEAFTRDSKSTDPHTQACALEGLGVLYEVGLGVKKDKTKAMQFYEQEGKLGYGIGYGRMARMFDGDQTKMSHYMDLCRQAPHKPQGDGRTDGCALAAGFGD
ncbi:hypothetical protein, partial [Helicobacter bizzozeronii]|uniref:SEL1-like repeat protein n=1 Tax=Helicobacter bizzozeronii TaxID=56877 RepID=UPI003D7F7BA7